MQYSPLLCVLTLCMMTHEAPMFPCGSAKHPPIWFRHPTKNTPGVYKPVGKKVSKIIKTHAFTAISDSALPNKDYLELQTKSSVNFISIHLGDV